MKPEPVIRVEIPPGLLPHFQEYDPANLDLERDSNLIIQRALEFGNWEETRWLFRVYGAKRIRAFLRQHGERWLPPTVFNYWRKLLKIEHWQSSPFPTPKGELWKP
ncbi:MAG: hypothetical protein JXA78_11860 [Anaerolineales bacterium]|nr:hypothetical protein [Anaerolineales bacterium]